MTTANTKQFSLAVSATATPLGPATKAGTAEDAPPVRRYIKPIYRLGSFTHPTKGWSLDMTSKRMNEHLSVFQKMKLAGIPVKLTKDHKTGADFVVGDIQEALRGNMVNGKFDPNPEGEWGAVVAEVTGQKNIELVESNKDASVEIDPFKVGPDQTRYGEHIRAVSIVPNPLVPGQTGFERIAADDGDVDPERPTYLFSDGEPEMKTLFSSIATLAATCGLSLSADGMTEASAVEAVGTVKAKLASLETEKTSLTKKLSDAGTGDDPDPKYLNMCKKNSIENIKSLKGTGQLSDAGILALTKELTANPSMMLSDGDGDDATSPIERIVKIFKDNPGVKLGGKTGLQQTRELDDGGRSNNGASGEPLTADRVKELLNMTPTGRDVVVSATAR